MRVEAIDDRRTRPGKRAATCVTAKLETPQLAERSAPRCERHEQHRAASRAPLLPQPRAARGPAGGRMPRAGACGCIEHSAARRPQGAALNKYGKSNHEARRAVTFAVGR